jgi:hypothetical protein
MNLFEEDFPDIADTVARLRREVVEELDARDRRRQECCERSAPEGMAATFEIPEAQNC